MTSATQPKLRVVSDREKRFKRGLKSLLRAGRGRSVSESLKRLAPIIRGWVGYFKLSDVKAAFERLDEWMRRRIRALFSRHWKRPKTRFREMLRRGVSYGRAMKSSGNGRGPWWNAGASHMNLTIQTKELRQLGLVSSSRSSTVLSSLRGHARRRIPSVV